MEKVMIKPRLFLGAAALLAVLSASCAHSGKPFTNSSLDFNRGRVHHIELECDVPTLEQAVVAAMRESKAQLIARSVALDGATVLRFRSMKEHPVKPSDERPGIELAAAREDPPGILEFSKGGSVYYVELARSGLQQAVTAVGVPIADGKVACPSVLGTRGYTHCKPEPTSTNDESFAASAARRFGVRVDGSVEADAINRTFASLRGSQWQTACAGLMRPVDHGLPAPPLLQTRGR